MINGDRIILSQWTVDYCDGTSTEQISVPHAWLQDVSVTYEGPVEYRTHLEVPNTPCKLRFHGVSYAAEVSIGDTVVANHTGIWDAFEVPLTPYLGRNVSLKVRVVKNGGSTYPVREVASGFLPYVFHTFGGIFGEVEIISIDDPLELPPAQQRVQVSGKDILVDGNPFYVRGLLHWGWYPEIGHTRAPRETIEREVIEAKKLGFNLIKFCLWVPPHEFLEVLRDHGMEAWIELPLWDPVSAPENQAQIADEFERVVRQYRHHDNVILWTVGCELSEATTPAYRARLVQMIKNLTGSPLIRDNSGGAEMYGGSLLEFGDFYDFHPYCDLHFYPGVLDTLLPGPRPVMPTLLGEFNDCDVHRDLARLAKELPFWGSTLSELNDQGVRWQHDLPEILGSNHFADESWNKSHAKLMESSRLKTLFIRKTVQEAVRARGDISGYVITGMRDTPISTAGFFDDWDQPRFLPSECLDWNSETCIFLIPSRRPPWVNGGNRPGAINPTSCFAGEISWKVGIHSEHAIRGGLIWRIVDSIGKTVTNGCEEFLSVPALTSAQIAQIHWTGAPGTYRLEVEFGTAKNGWDISVTEKLTAEEKRLWTVDDPFELIRFDSSEGALVLTTRSRGLPSEGVVILPNEGTKPMPFWRESAYEFLDQGFWKESGFHEAWERFRPIASDRAIDPRWLDKLEKPYQVLLNRVDTRNYAEHPVLVKMGECFITTLRLYGGLGDEPHGIPSNPSGTALLRFLANQLIERV